MSKKSLHFYFDFISPFAYFSWRRLPDLAQKHDLDLQLHPVVFGKLLDHWGQLGPAEIAPKTAWLARYSYRYATVAGFNYSPPKFHPFNPLPALRMALVEVSGSEQHKVLSAIFQAGWSQGQDIGDTEELLAILNQADIDCRTYREKINDQSIKNCLIKETEDAIAAGVFGVPTFIIDDELFWGNDQFDHMDAYLSGNDPLKRSGYDASKTRQRGIDRKNYRQQKRQT